MAKRKNDLVKTDTGYYDPVTQTTFKTTDTGQLADAETGEVIKDEVDMYDRFTKVFDGPFRTPLWKTPWNHDTDAEAARTGLSTTDVTKTQQHLAAETDINNILAKFIQTGHLPLTGDPIYQDLVEEHDLQTRMITGWEVEQAWNKLSAETRNILRDPQTFVEYIDHSLQTGDLEGLRKLGLAKPKIEPGPATRPRHPCSGPSGRKSGTSTPGVLQPPKVPKRRPAALNRDRTPVTQHTCEQVTQVC